MKFGKISDYRNADFSLPTNEKFDIRPSKNQTNQLYIGATGFNNKEWLGRIYPEKSTAKEYLTHYARFFNAIECNTTFYSIPDEQRIQNWLSKVPEHFRFNLKFPKAVSHSKDFGQIKGNDKKWIEAMHTFGVHQGITFVQFPNYITLTDVERFIQRWALESHTFDIALEIRNPDLFKQPTFGVLKNMIVQANMGLAITDVSGARDIFHVCPLGLPLFIRWVGNNDTEHDEMRIDLWVKMLQELDQALKKDIHFMVHQPDMLRVLNTAKSIVSKVKGSTKIATPTLQESNIQGQLF